MALPEAAVFVGMTEMTERNERLSAPGRAWEPGTAHGPNPEDNPVVSI